VNANGSLSEDVTVKSPAVTKTVKSAADTVVITGTIQDPTDGVYVMRDVSARPLWTRNTVRHVAFVACSLTAPHSQAGPLTSTLYAHVENQCASFCFAVVPANMEQVCRLDCCWHSSGICTMRAMPYYRCC
jgi:hypothetical protein